MPTQHADHRNVARWGRRLRRRGGESSFCMCAKLVLCQQINANTARRSSKSGAVGQEIAAAGRGEFFLYVCEISSVPTDQCQHSTQIIEIWRGGAGDCGGGEGRVLSVCV